MMRENTVSYGLTMLFFLTMLPCHFWRHLGIICCFNVMIIFRSSRPEVFCKKGVPKNLTKFTGKHLSQSLFFNKETLAQVFFCEFCKIFKNTFFYKTRPVAASVSLKTIAFNASKELWLNVSITNTTSFIKSHSWLE